MARIGGEAMNHAKYEAGQRLNQLQNTMNIINENIAALRAALDNAEAWQQRTAARIAEHRRTLADMPDDAA